MPLDYWKDRFQTANPSQYHQFKNKTPEKKDQMATAALYKARQPNNENFVAETAMMGKIADSGKIIRILKKAHTVPFSDEKNWLLVDTDPGKGNSGLGIKWIPADTRFEWVRPYRDSVEEGQGEQISKTKALNTLRKELMNSYEYMKCANLEEFKHRLQWLSEGMLKNHMTDGKSTVINREEIELYQEYRKKREQIQQGLTKGVDENFANSAETYRAHLIKTLPQIMKLFANVGKGWIPSKEQMLSAVDNAYQVMKHTGDAKQAGKALMDELNTLHRMSQGQQEVNENFADGRNPQDKGDAKRHGVPTKGIRLPKR